METLAHPLIIVSIFEQKKECDKISDLVQRVSPTIFHICIHGEAASILFNKGAALVHALAKKAKEVKQGRAIKERHDFSLLAIARLPPIKQKDRFLIISSSLVPLDLVFDKDGDWGNRAIFSHINTEAAPSIEILIRALFPQSFSLQGYLLACPMAMDRQVPRNLQDIITVATSLESFMPVEIWLQTKFSRALEAFSRTDLSWLHIDTHGTQSKIMLGPTRQGGRMATSEELPNRIFTPLLILVGCSLLSGPQSIGSTLFQKGATTVFGPCTSFLSLGVANSEEGEAAWYEVFFDSLIAGMDTGNALLAARNSVSGNGILKFAYLICGSSFLKFDYDPISI